MKKTIDQLNGIELNRSVSHATLRNYDLFAAFSDALLGTEDWTRLMDENTDIAIGARLVAEQRDNESWWETGDAIEAVWVLFETLDEYAPDGYGFGSTMGDASDFGFWSNDILDRD